MRRSTSLAVCWAPMRMMPSDRPRSAMSSSTSLIGELPSRGAYLLSSSIMVNRRPPGPASSLRAVSAASTTPTTNRCARSCRLCRSTTVSCEEEVEMARRGPAARSARMIGRQRPQRRAQPPDERVGGAGPGHRPGPVGPGVVVGQPVDDQVHQVLVGGEHLALEEHRAVVAEWLGVAPEPGRDLVDDDRVLLPVVLGVGEHVGQQLLVAELPQRPPERLDPAGAAGDAGPSGDVVRHRRRPEAGRRERLGGQPELGVLSPQVVVQPDVGLVEEQQVLTLDAEHQGLGVDRPRAEGAGAEDGMQQEQREAGLGGDPGDAADRHVRAPGAVEELHVDVDRSRRRGRGRPGPCSAIWSKYSAWARSAPVARRTASPGRGGT